MSKHVYSTFLVALTVVASAVAQTGSSSLTGTVSDVTNQIIPGCSVTLTNEASGDQRTDTTNGQGDLVFAGVSPGTHNTWNPLNFVPRATFGGIPTSFSPAIISFNRREPLSGYHPNPTFKDRKLSTETASCPKYLATNLSSCETSENYRSRLASSR